MAWQDALTIAGLAISVLGFIATLIGLWYAIEQIRLTKTAAEAATEAANNVLRTTREQFQRYAVSNLHRFFHEAIIHVENGSWEMASVRLHDSADQTAQMVHIDPSREAEWRSTTEQVRQWAETMRRISANKAHLQPNRWRDFKLALSRMIDTHHGPFAAIRGESNS